MAVLLVWDKDSYTGRFLVLFPFINVLPPKLVNLCRPSSLLSSPLPIVVLVSIFVPMQWAHQPYSSFLFPFLVLSLLCVVSP
jgi:hypothetical protein